MITDKIKFKPGYAKEDSKTFASAGVMEEGITPERIWRNLDNISVWPRFCDSIVDIQYLDSSDNDPHLFDKAQFNYTMADGIRVDAQVICFTHPKDDRVGRMAYQGTLSKDGKPINEMVAEFIVGVPDHSGKLDVEAALSFKEEQKNAAEVNYGDKLQEFLRNLVDWSKKHH